jgi:hypothetical protein
MYMQNSLNALLAWFNLPPMRLSTALWWALGIVVVVFGVIPSLFGAGRGVYLPQGTYGFTTSGLQPMMPSAAYDSSSVGGAPAMGIASYEKGESLSARNVASIMPPHVNGSTGSSAEAFEVTSYSASYETAHLDDTCASISTLMAETFVVFESANAYERGCSFSFKVEKAHVDDVLAELKALDPKSLSQNTYTIEQQVSDYTSREDSLKRKLASIDDTMKSSMTAYDEITRLATQSRDAGSLASIISSKIELIRELTRERISVTDELEQLGRAKARQLDGVSYTTFSVQVTERLYIDGTSIAESWRNAMRSFVDTMNILVQDLTINLVAVTLKLVLYIAYFFVLLIGAKYVVKFAQAVWKW